MACPTCSHTMHKLDSGVKHLWWCPRCGTLKEVVGHLGKEYVSAEAPKIVGRLREFVRMISPGEAGRWLREQAEVNGVLESTHTPEERK